MKNTFKISRFMTPISLVKDKTTRRTVKSSTFTALHSKCERSIQTNHFQRTPNCTDPRSAKRLPRGNDSGYRLLMQQTLCYVTPCGVLRANGATA